jgi:hypothetical protein
MSALRKDVEGWSLEQWQNVFFSVYGLRNAAWSCDRLWNRMLEEIGELVVPMARFYIPDIRWHLPDIFAWLCSASRRLSSKSLDTIVWEKFGKGCPHCKKHSECTCQDVGAAISTAETGIGRTAPAELFDLHQPENLDAWQTFFGNLYGRRNLNSEPLFLLGRLTEDVGRVSRMLRLRQEGEPVESMLASIFAWLCGICNRYSASYGKETAFRLSEIVYEKYKDECAACHARPCTCKTPLQRVFMCWPLSLHDAGQSLCGHIQTLKGVAVVQAEFTEKAYAFSELLRLSDASEHADAYVALVESGDTCQLFATVLGAARNKGSENLFIAAKRTAQGLNAPTWALEQPLSMVPFNDVSELFSAFDDWLAPRFKLTK